MKTISYFIFNKKGNKNINDFIINIKKIFAINKIIDIKKYLVAINYLKKTITNFYNDLAEIIN